VFVDETEAGVLVEISCSLPSCFMWGEPKCSSGALRFQWTRTAFVASPEVSKGPVPFIATAVVQLLACRAEAAIAFRL